MFKLIEIKRIPGYDGKVDSKSKYKDSLLDLASKPKGKQFRIPCKKDSSMMAAILRGSAKSMKITNVRFLSRRKKLYAHVVK